MKKIPVPTVVKVLNKDKPLDNVLRGCLESNFEIGGCEVEEWVLNKCKNTKNQVLYVTSNIGNPKPNKKNKVKIKIDKGQSMGKWIYCGKGWYVRKVDEKYEYSQWAAYDTIARKVIGLWDDAKYGRK